ncbi:hypothetical protein WN48_00151 [Eufriesea mexicana]|nr:hypothetical protein WN48_00151 [Eufriesea mexicana]
MRTVFYKNWQYTNNSPQKKLEHFRGEERIVDGLWKDRGRIVEGSWKDRRWVVDGSWKDRGWIVDGSWMDRGWIVDGSWKDRGRIIEKEDTSFVRDEFRISFVQLDETSYTRNLGYVSKRLVNASRR